MSTVSAKMPYLQRYSTDFRNLCLRTKMLRVAIWVESFRCGGIFLLQWKGEKFAHRQHLKFCQFQPVHCASKILLLQKYSTDFRNLCLPSKMFREGIWVKSFRWAVVLLFNFGHRKNLNFCRFQPVHCTLWLQTSYISKSIQPIFEIFASARRC